MGGILDGMGAGEHVQVQGRRCRDDPYVRQAGAQVRVSLFQVRDDGRPRPVVPEEGFDEIVEVRGRQYPPGERGVAPRVHHGGLAEGEEQVPPRGRLLRDELRAEAQPGVHVGEDGQEVAEVAVEDRVEVVEGADREAVGEPDQAEPEARERDQVRNIFFYAYKQFEF